MPVANAIITGWTARLLGSSHDVNDGASAGTHGLLCGGHSIRLVVARDAVTHVAHQPSIGERVLKHDCVAEFQRLVFSVSVGHL